MESVYNKLSLKDFRKIVSDHNKREKKDIMEEVKNMRLADRQKIKRNYYIFYNTKKKIVIN